MKIKCIAVVLTWGFLGLTVALLWLANGQPAAAQPTEWTVCPAGPPACDYAIIQDAVDAADEGDTIKVAMGVYTDVHGRPRQDVETTGVVTQVVYISKTVSIRGGYSADFSTWNPDTYSTTLDAQEQGRVLYVTGNISPTLEGLRITGGNASGLAGASWLGSSGGGIYVYSTTATIRDCWIYSNTASNTGEGFGGGVSLWNSAAIFRENTIISNTASIAYWGSGGGLYIGNSAATLYGNLIQNNVASLAYYGSGGGIFVVLSDGILGNNLVEGNVSSTAHDGWGGGIVLNASQATLNNNVVRGNTASLASHGLGGGLHLYMSNATLVNNRVQSNVASAAAYGSGGGLDIQSASVTLNGNIITENLASLSGEGQGGGVFLEDSQATLHGNAIISNTAALSEFTTGQGGGLWIHHCRALTMTNNLIASNHANTEGSGLRIGGLSSLPTSGILLHTSIADNRGSEQGVYVGENSTLTLTGTILVGHQSAGVFVGSGGMATLEATLWYSNGTDWAGDGTLLTGTVNVWGDPVFVAPGVGNYHIRPGSAAVDAGVDTGVTTDIDRQPRPYQEPDLGADEYWPPGVLKHVYLPVVAKNH